MEQYLEERKASQKRPAATFQRQDKKKAVYQTQQRSVAVGSTQVPSIRSPASSGDLLQLEARVDQGEGFPDPSLLWRSTKNPEESSFGGFLGLPKESFNSNLDPFGGLVGDPTSLEETVESDSERGE
ncbi:hypothetical protein Taro_050044 [Colocasia esculenta]|uniref:Uncharacterized protein n=1 Tax=Colocasia esculenta TaxID=4460 RepID=A0A843XCQ4_COLES|nr:hypothetical protein [Colocasia esculenta]